MEHLLGSFVPPPLLLVLVSSLHLPLLEQKSTLTKSTYFMLQGSINMSVFCFLTYSLTMVCKTTTSNRTTQRLVYWGSLTRLVIRVVIVLLLVLVSEQVQLYHLADVGGFLWGQIHSGCFQLLGLVDWLLRWLLLVQSSHLDKRVKEDAQFVGS